MNESPNTKSKKIKTLNSIKPAGPGFPIDRIPQKSYGDQYALEQKKWGV